MNKPTNALAALLPESLDQKMRSLVAQHGADAVRDAAKRATAKRKGRKPEKDWLNLKPWVEQDAEDWLDGRDAFALRSNYAVAKEFAEQFPGHNRYATKERIERKLRAKRRWYMLVVAYERSEVGFPAETYIRALRELDATDPEKWWSSLLELGLGRLALYREKFGEPDPQKSFHDLDLELRAKPQTLGDFVYRRRGLFGSPRVQNIPTILNSQEP